MNNSTWSEKAKILRFGKLFYSVVKARRSIWTTLSQLISSPGESDVIFDDEKLRAKAVHKNQFRWWGNHTLG